MEKLSPRYPTTNSAHDLGAAQFCTERRTIVMTHEAIVMMSLCFLLVFGGFIAMSIRLHRVSKNSEN